MACSAGVVLSAGTRMVFGSRRHNCAALTSHGHICIAYSAVMTHMPRFRLRTLLIAGAIAPALLAGLASVLFLGWAWWSGVPMGDDPAVQRAIENAKTSSPWDPN